MLELFALQPVRPTATASHIPLFLSTRPLAEMEAAAKAHEAQLKQSKQQHASDGDDATMTDLDADRDVLERIDDSNQAIQQLEEEFSNASHAVLKRLSTAAAATSIKEEPRSDAQTNGHRMAVDG